MPRMNVLSVRKGIRRMKRVYAGKVSGLYAVWYYTVIMELVLQFPVAPFTNMV